MTRSQVDAIIDRLDAQSKKIDELKADIDQMKGGLAVLKALGGLPVSYTHLTLPTID
jgi:hypothetical protein